MELKRSACCADRNTCLKTARDLGSFIPTLTLASARDLPTPLSRARSRFGVFQICLHLTPLSSPRPPITLKTDLNSRDLILGFTSPFPLLVPSRARLTSTLLSLHLALLSPTFPYTRTPWYTAAGFALHPHAFPHIHTLAPYIHMPYRLTLHPQTLSYPRIPSHTPARFALHAYARLKQTPLGFLGPISALLCAFAPDRSSRNYAPGLSD